MASIWKLHLISVLCPTHLKYVWRCCVRFASAEGSTLGTSTGDKPCLCLTCFEGRAGYNNCSELQLNEQHRCLLKNQDQPSQGLSWPEPAQQCSSPPGGLLPPEHISGVYVIFGHYLCSRSNNTSSLPCKPGASCRASSSSLLIFRQKLISASISYAEPCLSTPSSRDLLK